MVSNAFCKSIKIIPVKRPLSNPVVILSVRCPRQVWNSFCGSQTEIYKEFCFSSNILVFDNEQSFQ